LNTSIKLKLRGLSATANSTICPSNVVIMEFITHLMFPLNTIKKDIAFVLFGDTKWLQPLIGPFGYKVWPLLACINVCEDANDN
jgi:hypothetical protein